MFEKMTDVDLETSTRDAIKAETMATTNVVRHFVEIYRRDIHLKRGFSTVFGYIQENYDIGKASIQRRVSAMELALAVPEALAYIDDSRLCLQSAADIQKFLSFESGHRRAYSPDQKRQLVESLLDLSTREVEERLVAKNPDVAFKDSKKLIAPGKYKITYVSSAETEAKVERIRAIRSHATPFINRDQLIDYMAELVLEKIDPVRKSARASKATSARDHGTCRPKRSSEDLSDRNPNSCPRTPNAQAEQHVPAPELKFDEEIVSDGGEVQLVAPFAKRSRYIKAKDSHEVWREHDSCGYIDPLTKRRCGSTHQLQRDHVVSYCEGGSNNSENLQLLCAGHNRLKFRSRSSKLSAPRMNYAS